MSKETIDLALTGVSIAAEIAIFVPVFMRRIWRTFPVFSVYLLWALLSDVAGLSMQMTHPTDSAYLNFYRVEMIVDSTFMFAVLVELFWSVLRPVRTSLPKGSIFVVAGLIALVGLLIWPLAGMMLPLHLSPEAITIFRLQQTFAILRIVCFLVMAAFGQLLSINWRDRELQIATGLGIYALVSLTVTVFHAHQPGGTELYHQLDELVSVSYVGTLVYWVLSFAGKEYQRKEFSPQMQQFLVYMGGTARAGSMALSKMPPDHSTTRDK